MGWLDDLLEVGTVFDWISPLASIAGDIANGGGYTFLIPVDCGWTGAEIARLLRKDGITTYGHMIVNSRFMISVPQAQAARARWALDHAGLDYAGPPVKAEAPAGGGLGDLLAGLLGRRW